LNNTKGKIINDMCRNILISFILITFSLQGTAQKKIFTKTGIISFSSKTTIENIEAKNKKVLAVIDLETNKIEFSLLIKGFEFEKALMQEHFNENYLESDKYPKALFKGNFDEPELVISSAENKTHILKVTGNLTLHGITKQVRSVATVTVKEKVISATSDFTILLSDYAIKVPSVVSNNINREIQVKINIPLFQEMK
jgi:YceI-like domain